MMSCKQWVRIFPLVMIGFWATPPALAQEPPRTAQPPAGEAREPEARTEEQPITVPPIVIKDVPAKTSQKVEEIPGTVHVITREEIERTHAKTTDELLRRIPGINIIEEHGQGLRPNIGIRGVNPIRSRDVLVLVDGIPIQPALYGDAAMYYNIPIELVERIEVIKGGASVLYAPNTQGGVINFITKKLPETPRLALKETVGSHRFFSSDAYYGGRSGKKGARFGYVRRQGDGFRDHSAFWLNDFGLRFEASPDATSDLVANLYWYNEVAQTPGALSPAQFAADLTKAVKQHDEFRGQRASFDLTYSTHLNASNALRILTYGNFFERNWFIQDQDSSGALQATNSQFRRKFNVLGVEPQWLHTYGLLGRAHNLTLGLRYYVDRLTDVQAVGTSPSDKNGTTTANADLETVAYSAYAETGFRLTDRLTLTPGVRWESVTLSRERLTPSTTNFKNESTTQAVIYGMGTSYRLPRSTLLFGHVHTTFRPPTFAQAIDPTTGTRQDLEPETGLSSDIGVRSKLLPWLSAELSLFRLDFKNKIAQESGRLINVGRSLHQGVEGDVRFNWGELWPSVTGVTSRFMLTLMNAESRSGATAGKDLPFAPRVLMGWGIGYVHPSRASIDLDGTFTGQQFTDTANTQPENALGTTGAMPSYTLWNVRLGYHHPTYPFSVFGGVRNLFEEKFIVNRTSSSFVGVTPGETRTFYVGASYNY